jgi:hypothetical protein
MFEKRIAVGPFAPLPNLRVRWPLRRLAQSACLIEIIAETGF